MKLALMLSTLATMLCAAADDTLRTEHFDTDPQWEGNNNRATASEPREVTQDFGYTEGRIGGTVTPDGVPAFYAREIPGKSLDDALSASGSIFVEAGPGNTLLGFFNTGTLNEWRTPNAIVFRINGRGETFHVHFEYATAKWRAGAGVIGRFDAQADRVYPVELPANQEYDWTLRYDPAGNNGGGLILATFGEHRAECAISPEHRADGATFNRFGLLNTIKSVDSPGRMWLTKVTVFNDVVDMTKDPGWQGLNNRNQYVSKEVRPRFDFGYSNTQFAGGAAAGEIGGLFYRGDCRYPDKMACYGAPLESLNLSKPLHASGRVVLRKGVSDSTTLFGFYHDLHSMKSNPSQNAGLPMDFLGCAIEGPSRDGFFLYPTWRNHGDHAAAAVNLNPPVIYPDGVSHEWTLDYTPPAAEGGEGMIRVTMDGHEVLLPVPAEAVAEGAQFNRFGFVTPWIDGNAQRVYLDDVTYSVRQ